MSLNESLNIINKLKKEISKVFVSKEDSVHNLLLGLFSGLHVLIEDIPGVGKTTLAKTLAKCTALDFGRIQFTPDLIPGDILGMTIWSLEKKEFIFKEGALMHQFILADEINRANARTQSSLLEAMQEESITVDGKTYKLPQPFFVVATQNPINFAGTFQLPESQLDRFGISFSIGYPTAQEEIIILERFKEKDPFNDIEPVLNDEYIISIREIVKKIHISDKLKEFIVKIAKETRKSKEIKLGMSPRATQQLLKTCQCEAFFNGRDFVIPEDIINTIHIVLNHKLILTAKAKMENFTVSNLITQIINNIKIPTGIKQS